MAPIIAAPPSRQRATSPGLAAGPWPGRVLLLLVSAALLFFRIGQLSLSVDEFVNVEIDTQSLAGILAELRAGTDLHPPVTHWLAHAWIALFGASELAVRLPWALAGVVSVAGTYQLGRQWGSPRLGWWAAALLATSPAFVQYSRFAKYYAFTLLLAVALALVFTRLARRETPRRLAAYTALVTVFLYTDYFGIFILVLWQDLFLLLRALQARPGPEWRRLGRVLLAQSLAGLLWLPWLAIALNQGQAALSMTEADLSGGWRAVAIKVAYALYSFTLGETLFPWRPAAIVGGLAAGVALLSGLWVLIRRAPRAGVWSGTLAWLSIGLLAVLCSTIITSVPFITFANHILFALPFFLLWLVNGVAALPRAWLRAGVLAALVGAHTAGLANYYAGRDAFNPIYVVPTRQIVQTLAQEAGPDDLVLAEIDTGIPFYAQRTPGWPAALTVPGPAAQQFIAAQRPPRVWVFTFGRDRTRSDLVPALENWLAQNDYTAGETRGFAPQDSLYRALKERWLGRSAYLHKLALTVYERQP